MPGAAARFDAAVDDAVESIRNPALDQVFYALSAAADHSKLWHGVAWTRVGIKSLVGRVRPERPAGDGPLPYNMRVPITSSFPSGHATAAFTAAVFLSDDGAALAPLWFGLAGVVAFSRVYVRMHHASDVVAGAALGIVMGRTLHRMLGRTRHNGRVARRPGRLAH
jgi:undecaprenyl-diphosphatase